VDRECIRRHSEAIHWRTTHLILGIALDDPYLAVDADNVAIRPLNLHYSQRNTFDESAVQIANTATSAATSPLCADHASPFQILWSRDTA
jgi:hypothetical protein